MEHVNNVCFPGVKDGETFLVDGIEFIKFPDMGGVTPVVAKDILFRSEFGDGNNLASSKVLKRMEAEILPRVIGAVGEENVCLIQTDLTTWDGLKTYGVLESKISLPTMDFYRDNVEIFDKHKASWYWWLATADSVHPHDDPWWVLCVSPSGRLYFSRCVGDNDGVRPFLLFVSSIFDAGEE